MAHTDKVGTAATGIGVVGIGILAAAFGFGLAPSPAHMEGAHPTGVQSGQGFAARPGAPVPDARVPSPIAQARSGEVWFKGFELNRVNEPFGLLHALARHEEAGRLDCQPKLAGKDVRTLMRIDGVSCAGNGLRVTASLVDARLASMRLNDNQGGELFVVGDYLGHPGTQTGALHQINAER
jgi:hypothetical protein